jgi:hypothetical protein
MKDEVSRQFRILNNDEPYDLYRSPSIVRIVKYRRLLWGGHVVRV